MRRLLYILIGLLVLLGQVYGESDGDNYILEYIEKSDKIKYVNIDSSLLIAKKACELVDVDVKPKLYAECLYNLANIYRVNNFSDKAIPVFHRAKEYLELNDSLLLAKIDNNIGLAYKKIGRLDSAIVYFHRSLQLRKNDKGKAQSLQNIGITYRLVGDYENSIIYYNKCLSIYEEKRDSIGIASVYNSMGGLYFETGELRDAIFYFNEFLKLTPSSEKLDIEIAYGNIGATYEQLDLLDSAFMFTSKALTISKDINDEIGIVINLTNLGNILAKQNKYEEALNLYLEANQLADSLQLKNEQKDILESMSNAYAKLGNYDLSLLSFKKHTMLKDSIINGNTQKLIVKEQEKYNAAQREKDIIRLKAEKKQKEQRAQFLTYLVYGIIAFVTIVAFFVYVLLKERNRKRKISNEQKVAIAMLRAEEVERERISHELHDRLGSLLTVAKYKISGFHEYLPEVQYDQIIDMLTNAASVSRSLSHQLFATELKDFGLQSAIDNLFKTLNESNQLQKFAFSSDLTSENRLPWEVELQLFRITQELITNALKYSEASEIKLFIDFKKGKIKYRYVDNGKGFNYNGVKKGIGLEGINTRAKSVDLKFKVNTALGKGLEVIID